MPEDEITEEHVNTCPYWRHTLAKEPLIERQARNLASHLLWGRCPDCIREIERLLANGGTTVADRWYDSPVYRYPYAKRAMVNRVTEINMSLLRAIESSQGVWGSVPRSEGDGPE